MILEEIRMLDYYLQSQCNGRILMIALDKNAWSYFKRKTIQDGVFEDRDWVEYNGTGEPIYIIGITEFNKLMMIKEK